MKKILVTGARGFVGNILVKKLLDLDCEVASIAHTKNDFTEKCNEERCKKFTANVLKPGLGLGKVMIDVDVVIHLAARVHVMNDKSSDSLEDFRQANVEYTKKLVDLAIASKVKRFIYISSLHVNGAVSSDHPFNEKDDVNPTSPYAVSKLESELYLNSIAKKINMEVVIIRPPLIYGPGVKVNFLSLLKLTKTGLPLPVGLLSSKRSMIGVNNLVDFIACCIEHPNAANETFLISDDCDVSTRELFAKLIRLFGKTPLLLPIPSKMLYLLGSLLGKKSIVDRLCAPLQVDIKKAKTLINWKPVQTLDDGLKETVEWYKKERL